MVKSATSVAAKLHFASSKLRGRTFELTQDRVNVGRDTSNLLRLDDTSVSTHHAILVRLGAHYRVRDLISTNGTYVNGERTLGAELHDGDRLRFGAIEMKYEEMPFIREPVKVETETVQPLGRRRSRPRSARALRRAGGTVLFLAVAGVIAWQFDAWPFGVRGPLNRFGRSAEAHVRADPAYAAVDAAEDAKDYAKLLEAARQLRRHHPQSALANYILGTAYGKLGYYLDAAAAFREAIKLEPNYIDAWNNLGWAYGRAGQFPEAIAVYQQLTKLAPNETSAWIELGNANAHAGRPVEAIAAYQTVIRLKPDSADGYFHLGAAFANQGKYADAISAFHQALRYNPNLPEAWFNLGVISQQQGANDEAILSFQKAIHLQAGYAEAWGGLVKSYLNLHQNGKASEAAREMKRLDPAKADLLADELSREVSQPTTGGTDSLR